MNMHTMDDLVRAVEGDWSDVQNTAAQDLLLCAMDWALSAPPSDNPMDAALWEKAQEAIRVFGECSTK